jgi:preprotein translocase subunit SecG
MENDEKPAPSNPHPVRGLARHVSRTRLVMAVLLIVAMLIFVNLANQAVHENAEAIRQSFGR